jgi:hypothetical protein
MFVFKLKINLKLDELVRKIRDKNTGLVIKDRTWHLKTYKKCFIGIFFILTFFSYFTGEEAVKWFMTNIEGVDRAQAMVIGDQLIEEKIIHHVVHQQPFRNGFYFYRFQVPLILHSSINYRTGRRRISCAKYEENMDTSASADHDCAE